MSQSTRAGYDQRNGSQWEQGPGQNPGSQWGQSPGQMPSIGAGFRQMIGATLAKAGTRVLEGRSSRSGRHAQYTGQFGDTERGGQYPWSPQQQSQQQRGTRQTQQVDLDQADYVSQFDGRPNPWQLDINLRPEFPSTMTGAMKGTVLRGLDDQTIDALFKYCPGAAVALVDWFVLHQSQSVLPMARRRLTGLLQTVYAGVQATASAKMGVREARDQHNDQLTAAVDRAGVRYMEIRDSQRFEDLDELRKAAAKLSTTLDTRHHVGRQVSACIIEAVTEFVTGNPTVADEKMARALTLLDRQFNNTIYTEIARGLSQTVVEQTLNDIEAYSSPQDLGQSRQDQPASRPYAMAGVGQSRDIPGQQRRPGDDQEPPL